MPLLGVLQVGVVKALDFIESANIQQRHVQKMSKAVEVDDGVEPRILGVDVLNPVKKALIDRPDIFVNPD